MTDWIQDAKRRADEERKSRLIEERARQDRADQIRESLQNWWDTFIRQIKQLAQELKTELPEKRQCHFAVEPSLKQDRRIRLRSESGGTLLDIWIMESYPALSVQWLSRGADTSESVANGPPRDGQFEPGNHGLLISYEGSTYADAGSLADKIMRDLAALFIQL
jgi:hypothetical protein